MIVAWRRRPAHRVRRETRRYARARKAEAGTGATWACPPAPAGTALAMQSCFGVESTRLKRAPAGRPVAMMRLHHFAAVADEAR